GRPVVRSDVREQPFGLIPCERLPTQPHCDSTSGPECSVRETLALVVVQTFRYRSGVPEESAGEQPVVLEIRSQPVKQFSEQFRSTRSSLREQCLHSIGVQLTCT